MIAAFYAVPSQFDVIGWTQKGEQTHERGSQAKAYFEQNL